MSLQKNILKQAIIDLRNIDINSGDKENDEIAERLANAIDEYVKTGTVTVTGGSSAGTYPVQ